MSADNIAERMADQIESAYQTHAEICEELDQLKRHKSALEDRVTALVEALTWYARQAWNCRKLGSIGEPARNALDSDGGQRARAALKAAGVATEGGLEEPL